LLPLQSLLSLSSPALSTCSWAVGAWGFLAARQRGQMLCPWKCAT
jgi:hypothetical protein